MGFGRSVFYVEWQRRAAVLLYETGDDWSRGDFGDLCFPLGARTLWINSRNRGTGALLFRPKHPCSFIAGPYRHTFCPILFRWHLFFLANVEPVCLGQSSLYCSFVCASG